MSERNGSGAGRIVQVVSYVDIEVDPATKALGLALVLPGRAYTPARALLDFTTRACTSAGWRVRQVWWEPPAGHPAADPAGDPEARADWVRDQVVSALTDVHERVLVVGKSLGTFAASLAAERRFESLWLTPVLTEPVVAEAIAANVARQLLVGGSADAYWRTDLALPDTTEQHTVTGADHAMNHADGARASVLAHLEAVTRVQDWLRGGARPDAGARPGSA